MTRWRFLFIFLGLLCLFLFAGGAAWLFPVAGDPADELERHFSESMRYYEKNGLAGDVRENLQHVKPILESRDGLRFLAKQLRSPEIPRQATALLNIALMHFFSERLPEQRARFDALFRMEELLRIEDRLIQSTDGHLREHLLLMRRVGLGRHEQEGRDDTENGSGQGDAEIF